jgi:hypothetical protein
VRSGPACATPSARRRPSSRRAGHRCRSAHHRREELAEVQHAHAAFPKVRKLSLNCAADSAHRNRLAPRRTRRPPRGVVGPGVAAPPRCPRRRAVEVERRVPAHLGDGRPVVHQRHVAPGQPGALQKTSSALAGTTRSCSRCFSALEAFGEVHECTTITAGCPKRQGPIDSVDRALSKWIGCGGPQRKLETDLALTRTWFVATKNQQLSEPSVSCTLPYGHVQTTSSQNLPSERSRSSGERPSQRPTSMLALIRPAHLGEADVQTTDGVGDDATSECIVRCPPDNL